MLVDCTLLSRAMSSWRIDAVEDDVLGFPGEGDDAHALDHEIAVGQHVGDEDGGAGGEALGVAHITAAGEAGLAGGGHAGELAAVFRQAGVEEFCDRVLEARFAGGFLALRTRGDGGFGDDDRDDVARRRGLAVGIHAALRAVARRGPEGIGAGERSAAHEQERERKGAKLQRVWPVRRRERQNHTSL
jgi:hypothetical protein